MIFISKSKLVSAMVPSSTFTINWTTYRPLPVAGFCLTSIVSAKPLRNKARFHAFRKVYLHTLDIF